MSGLSLIGLRAQLGSFHLGPVDVSVGGGEALAVIGPSGAGKTTLLRAIAGFVPLQAGAIEVDGASYSDAAPEARRFGYVPQGLALFPHRSVRQNVRYPLEIGGASDREGTLDALLETWGLTALQRSMPSDLSGGEAQRTAMARALAASPRALLWDEPLSALDPLARSVLIDVVLSALRREAIPMLLVTHDAETAFSVAERFLVIEHGCAVFVGTSAELCERPPTAFAARFVGYDNVLSTERLRSLESREMARWFERQAGPSGACFSADAVTIVPETSEGWTAIVQRVRRTPGGLRMWLEVGGEEIRMLMENPDPAAGRPGPGSTVRIHVAPEAVRPLGPRTSGG